MEKPDPAAVPTTTRAQVELEWHDVTDWGVEGRVWAVQPRQRYFDRLPAAAEAETRGLLDFFGKFSVWDMSRCSAGMRVRFDSNATAIHVRYDLRTAELALPHMPATGVSGVDLYARVPGEPWRYVLGSKPTSQQVNMPIVVGLESVEREFALYLPLYNGVESLEIGVPVGASFKGVAPRGKPIVFYGTSITQGGVASRPGICHTAILGRRLDRPVLNLGFSGTGKMDPVIGRLLTQVDAAAFVIECCGNMQPQQIRDRCVPLVQQLRAVHPKTPIVLVEDRGFPNAWIVPDRAVYNRENHAALRESFAALNQAGVPALHYIAGASLYGDDTEGSTDNSHANDLGFMRMADVMEPTLRAALGA
ncbi:MAG: SGNH/GDSL hydrolase family protein [Opitutaceae bacterium]|nr:SGNH/GDSL hydrolase family protein [Cephaloticoccus sp.]MCP5529853.1 SGNH/GDSL hydrolase family protein [Opitutaceae bacterium]